MSNTLISRSPDLKRLRDEGYDVVVLSGYLLVRDVPYLNARREIKRGILVSKLVLADDVTTRPDDHVAYFQGDYPCHEDGSEIARIRNQTLNRDLAEGVTVNHSFSAKPKPSNLYENYYDKVTTYVAILSGPAQAIDSTVTARTFPVVEAGKDETDAVFNYVDTASSRAEIVLATNKLRMDRIAIVGLGGTGAYVFDLTVKTPVREIHLFDGDIFSQHNAFRAPGAASNEDLRARIKKVHYYHALYSKMRRGIVPHDEFINADNVIKLKGMNFVFLCMDGGPIKKLIVQELESFGVPFIDVGMGVDCVDEALGGILRVTASTPDKRDHVWEKHRIPFGGGEAQDDYDTNIQVADLNAFNAALAVVKWKKLFGFYRDFEQTHFSTYTIDVNLLTDEDPR